MNCCLSRSCENTKAQWQAESAFRGRWHIVAMDGWDVDYRETKEPAFIEFGADQMGDFWFKLTGGDIEHLNQIRSDARPAHEDAAAGQPG